MLYEQGRGVQKNEALAQGYFTVACNLGEAAGCTNVGLVYLQGRGVDKDEALAEWYFTTACDRGHAAGCFHLASLLDQRGGTEKDAVRVRALRRVCNGGGGDGEGCFRLANALKEGRGVNKDEERAFALFLKACDQGSMAGCVAAGLLYEQGYGTANADTREALYTKACNGGDAAGCFHLGALLGWADDKARAAELWAKACARGNHQACASLADRLAEGVGVAKDEARAAALYTKACDVGDASSCFKLGVLVEEGRGAAKDRARATALFQGVCDAGDVKGCIKVYSTTCDGGDASGCLELGLLFDQGRGVKQDRARAAALFSKACKGGNSSGCTAEKLKKHFSTILSALANRTFSECREPAPSDAILATANKVRIVAQSSDLPQADLNVRFEPWRGVSPLFTELGKAKGIDRFEVGSQLLSAPAILVIDVEAFVEPVEKSNTGNFFGWFTPGRLTVRLVRFDSKARPTCQKRVTIRNGNLTVEPGSNWVTAAHDQLRDLIPGSFGY